MYVMFDTNIFTSDFHLKSHEFKKFRDSMEKIGIAFFGCPFVYDEAAQKYKEFLVEYNKKTNFYQNIIPNYCQRLSDVEIEELTNQYKNYIMGGAWESVEMKVKLAQPDSKNLYFSAIFDKALTKQKPFDHEGRGLRDLIIWESLKEAIRAYLRKGQIFSFISDNYTDFCGDEVKGQLWYPLHEQLQNELNEICDIELEPGSVRVYRSLKAFNHDLLSKKEVEFDNLVQSINREKYNEVQYIINRELRVNKANFSDYNSWCRDVESIEVIDFQADSVVRNYTDSLERLSVLLKARFRANQSTVEDTSAKIIEKEIYVNVLASSLEIDSITF